MRMSVFKSLFCLLALVLGACSGTQMLNTLAVAQDVDQATNLVYDDATGGRLDIYAPRGVRNAPVVVFFYGGRWSDGHKEEYEFVGKALAQRGYVTLIPDVRQYPQVRFPVFIEDGARVVKWAQDNAARYGGGAQRLFLMGHSSGAHIAAMLTLNEDYLKPVGGSRDWVKGMIGLAGPYAFMPITAPDLRDLFGPPEAFEKSQPIYYVDGRNPPLLLIHGEDDDTVSVKNSRSLAHAIKSANGQVETVIYIELSHRMAVATLAPSLQSRADVMDSVADFIRRTLEDPQPSSGVAGKAFEEPPDLPQGEALPPAEPAAAPQPLQPLEPATPAEPVTTP